MRSFNFYLLILVIFAFTACKKDSKRRIEKFHRQEVGSSAHKILSDKDYESLTVEIVYMTGYRPTDDAMNNLKAMISQFCNKPGGITFTYHEISAQGKTAYSISDVRTIETDTRQEFTYKKDLAIYFLFLDGPSNENQGGSMVLGQAYYNTSMVIYEKTLQDHSGGFGEPELYKLETAVMNHELGHILGLVNNGSNMYYAHQDAAHGAHCDNSDCLMYWEAETGTIFNNLLGNAPIPILDDNCVKDLKENGGK
ncbi:membrane metalloprotease [Fluviicola sp.]|uniref:membrane metalloprotease n=1 Tax=Fluviicola sp. TaxID=1917219 RepID=UPI002628A5C9|nr:membrane metalloprotease [Fluviicola sp.]